MVLTPLFKLMAEKQASDLFFSAGTSIHIKINGITRPVNNQILDSAKIKEFAYNMMSEQQIRDFESDWEINFSSHHADIGTFRVNVFFQRGSLSMVIRYIREHIQDLDALMLPPMLKELIMEKRGLVLVVGAAGEGKSTTLASMIEYRNQRTTGHILTIEDPIEYRFTHKKSIINQREVGADTRSYSNALANAMREAPDVVMIGEIIDKDTLRHTLLFSQAGHLCLSTLHANNSYHALSRIITFFPYEARASLLADLAISLKCIISQRLVPGINGKLVAAVEILPNTKHISELIKLGEIDQIKEAMEKSLASGCQTFEQSLYKLYKSGQISYEDAMNHSDSPSNLSSLIEYSEHVKNGEAVRTGSFNNFQIDMDGKP
ncbi:MAG: PilT/PilU family type 4a pilus ATPase [Burkholderiales bacterium]|nr:PilT/PilU family type 4a pilus ATPase [Burkholderiales bacterium]